MIDMETVTHRLRTIKSATGQRDENAWPTEMLEVLADHGLWGTAIPTHLGGLLSQPADQLRTYEAIAREDLSLALIITQHDGACALLRRSDNKEPAERVLRSCAMGKSLATVGISQLTTSGQTKGPALRAAPRDGGFVLNGMMPWVTSAAKSDYIVTGAVLNDGQQILACLPTTTAGLVIEPPMRLMALSSSYTSVVRCNGVPVTQDQLMKGPVAKALKQRAPAKPLTVSSVGIGMAGALLAGILERSPSLPDANDLIINSIQPQYDALRKKLYRAAEVLDQPDQETPATQIRAAVNDLISRLALTLITLGKGSAYLSASPLQRLAREAMFFLVWSAHKDVQTETLHKLWAQPADDEPA